MTKDEVVKIMAMLGQFYGGVKANPREMAQAWYLVLNEFDYKVAQVAIINFVKNDTRDYNTFPTVGKIVDAIRTETKSRAKPIREIKMAISYGRSYDQLPDECRRIISKIEYGVWSQMNAEQFERESGRLMRKLTERVELNDTNRNQLTATA